ncbi:hypothetical protein ACHAWT_001542 [Skeletonema menzelii]
MDTMNQQEPSTPERAGVTASDVHLCRSSWFTSSQRPNIISPRKRVSTIDEEDQRPAYKLKRCADAADGMVTPRDFSPPATSNDMVFDLPLYTSPPLKGGVQNSSSPTEDIKTAAAAGAAKEAFSIMDDEPVWGDSMYDMEDPSAFASSVSQPALATRKVTAADCDEDSKQEDFSSNMFGWFTDDVKEDVKFPNSMTDASLVSGGSSEDDLTNVGEVKQPFLLPAVSLEDEDSSSVINNRKLPNATDGDIDADMNLDEPVFEDVILDPSTLHPSAASLDDFDFDEPAAPTTSSFLGSFSSAPHLTTLDPLPCLKTECGHPAVKNQSPSLVNEVMAMDLLADVADAASMSMELTDDPLVTAYNVDASTSSEDEMMSSHQTNNRKGKDLSLYLKEGKDTNDMQKGVCAWRKKFDQLREFAREHGHCNVPQKYPSNPSLGRWVARQRLFMRQCLDAQEDSNAALPSSQMDADERMKLLRTIGLHASPNKKGSKNCVSGVFISCRNNKEWDNRFAELLRYKTIYGNCDVPVKTEGDFKSLGRWVTSQRKKYKEFNSGEMTGIENADQFLTRFRRLDEIGFKFKIGSGRGNGRRGKRKPKYSPQVPTN